jgi:uncharacterized protein
MKMALDSASQVNVVRSYAPGRVAVRDSEYTSSLIIWGSRIHDAWDPPGIARLRPSHLQPVTEDPPEVLILGTGERQVFPDPSTFTTLMDLGIGFEVMDNAAACRTYNILLAEQRQVALALLIDAD